MSKVRKSHKSTAGSDPFEASTRELGRCLHLIGKCNFYLSRIKVRMTTAIAEIAKLPADSNRKPSATVRFLDPEDADPIVGRFKTLAENLEAALVELRQFWSPEAEAKVRAAAEVQARKERDFRDLYPDGEPI